MTHVSDFVERIIERHAEYPSEERHIRAAIREALEAAAQAVDAAPLGHFTTVDGARGTGMATRRNCFNAIRALLDDAPASERQRFATTGAARFAASEPQCDFIRGDPRDGDRCFIPDCPVHASEPQPAPGREAFLRAADAAGTFPATLLAQPEASEPQPAQHPEDSNECDYCRGKGWYFMDGSIQLCFCAEENEPQPAPVDPWRAYLTETRDIAARSSSIGASVAVALIDDLLARGPR